MAKQGPGKGKTNNPKGRPKGSQNKDLKRAREGIAVLVEKNVPLMQEWLEGIRKEEGYLAAWKCMTDIIEYHIPKLSRTELTGDPEKPVHISEARRVIVDNAKSGD